MSETNRRPSFGSVRQELAVPGSATVLLTAGNETITNIIPPCESQTVRIALQSIAEKESSFNQKAGYNEEGTFVQIKVIAGVENIVESKDGKELKDVMGKDIKLERFDAFTAL